MNKHIMQACGFEEEVKAVEAGKCPICGNVINTKHFKDVLSVKEFHISGICQACQDETFD